MPHYEHIVILTGAGLLAESGVATFRDKDGIWSKVRIEDAATPDAFVRDPARVQAFVSFARPAGAHTVELNLEPSLGSNFFDEAIHGPATQVVPAFVDRLLA
jgi:NAD-dependent deacetylase